MFSCHYELPPIGAPPKPQPYGAIMKTSTETGPSTSSGNTHQYLTPFDTGTASGTGSNNRFSYDSTRDSRDSALVNIDASLFDSIGEESTISPISGVQNPIGDTAVFDFGQLNDTDFFETLDKIDQQQGDLMSHDDPWLVTGEGSNAYAGNTAGSGNRLNQQQFDQIWDSIQTTTNF